jgi:pilus assembly protein CpaB
MMSKRILAGAAALLLAVVGAVAVLAYARTADQRALQGQQAVSAYVVRKDVPVGTTARKAIDDGLIVKELIASKGVPEGALTTVDPGYENLVATSDLQAGELVLQSRFSTQAAVDGRLIIPDGKMAVSVALDDPSHVGPFLTVGSHIAIFDTFNVLKFTGAAARPAGDHVQDQHEYQRSTRVLVPDVVVLAIGATTTSSSSSGKAKNSSDMQAASQDTSVSTLVTLVVNQDQATRIIHAERTGTMTFALLGADAVPTVGVGVDDTRIFNGVTK